MTEIYNILLSSNTINFLIVVAIAVFLCHKLKAGKIIEEMQKEIKDYVDDSSNEIKNAREVSEQTEEKVKKLPSYIETIKSDTEKNIINMTEKSHEEIEKQKTNLQNNAKRLSDLQIKDFKQKLTNILSEKSVESAKQNAINRLNENEELHNKYIEEAISEIDGINL